MLEILNEKDNNGYWFTVYLNGQPIDGFRDYQDACMFGRWFASRDSTSQNEYINHVSGEGTNTTGT